MNIVNSHKIKRILKRPNAKHGSLLRECCARALARDQRCLKRVVTYPDPAPKWLTPEKFEARGPFYEFVLPPEVARILKRLDKWLKEAVEKEESWIDKKDDSGRVKRLLHVRTLDDAQRLCDEDEARATRKKLVERDLAEGNDPADVQTAHRFDDGMVAVKLKTPTALRWEGRHMRHCLGDLAYARRLTTQGVKYYSIRDAQGRPHVTLEVVGRRVTQCKGRANHDPVPAYGAKIEWLAGAMDWHGSALDGERAMADYMTLNEMVFRRDVSLSEAMLPLARTLYARGTVRATGLDRLTTLPWVMHVRGDLILRKCRNLRHMPEWLRVDGDLVLEDCGAVRQLASNVFVGGTLSMNDCPHILIDPERSFIGRTQRVRQSPGTGAPPSLRIAASRAQPIRPDA
jgi:hypothetical protein